MYNANQQDTDDDGEVMRRRPYEDLTNIEDNGWTGGDMKNHPQPQARVISAMMTLMVTA